MQPTQEAIDDIYRERVRSTRRMPPERKLLEGPRLFDEECRQRMEQLWKEHPMAREADIRRMLHVEIDRRRREEEDGIYFPVGILE